VKHEEVYLKAYENLTEARRELGAYFDFYNHRRRHQGLADRTPDEVYWSTLRTQATAA
jgi:putative transposase